MPNKLRLVCPQPTSCVRVFTTGTVCSIQVHWYRYVKVRFQFAKKTYSTVRPTLTVKWKVKLTWCILCLLVVERKKVSIFRVFWSDPPSDRKQKSPWTSHSALRAFRPWWSKCVIMGVLERSTLSSGLEKQSTRNWWVCLCKKSTIALIFTDRATIVWLLMFFTAVDDAHWAASTRYRPWIGLVFQNKEYCK